MPYRKISLFIQSFFYLAAVLNHFLNPGFYLGVIPEYIPAHPTVNLVAGISEILLGIGLLVSWTRKVSVYAIIFMLIAFIPSHVYFIQIGGCVEEGLCAPEWVGWVRLIIIHPLLILWAWSVRNV